jgi:hypothetical protein
LTDYQNLSDSESRKLFDDLGRAYFAKEQWRSSFARMVDFQPRTVAKWMEPDNCPPQWALMLLASLTEAQGMKSTLLQLGSALDAIAQLNSD